MRKTRTFNLKTLLALTLTVAVLVRFWPVFYMLGESVVVYVSERMERNSIHKELEKVNSAGGRTTWPDR